MSITASSITAYNTASTLTFYAGQASMDIDMDEADSDKVLLIVQNTNDAANVETATITVAAGDFIGSAAGAMTVNVPDNSAFMTVGPLEGHRFKNSASKIAFTVAVTQSGTVSSVKFAVVKVH
jgi:hypothetical protein